MRRSRDAAIAANSVEGPVLAASTVAVPLRTDVPVKTALVRCATAASGADRPGDFTTGNASPVNTASLTLKSRASRRMPSAGIRLPAESRITSPGTMSSASTEHSAPSRSMIAFREMRCFSASVARDAPYSCVKLSTQLASTIAPMIAASLPLPTKVDTMAANMRIRTSGLRNCRAKRPSAVCAGPRRGRVSAVFCKPGRGIGSRKAGRLTFPDDAKVRWLERTNRR